MLERIDLEKVKFYVNFVLSFWMIFQLSTCRLDCCSLGIDERVEFLLELFFYFRGDSVFSLSLVKLIVY